MRLCVVSMGLKTGDICREKHLSLHKCNVKRTTATSNLSNLSAVLCSQAQTGCHLLQSSWLPCQDSSRLISTCVLPENGKSGVVHIGMGFLMSNPAKHPGLLRQCVLCGAEDTNHLWRLGPILIADHHSLWFPFVRTFTKCSKWLHKVWIAWFHEKVDQGCYSLD